MTEIEKLKKEIENLKLIIESKNNQVESKNKQIFSAGIAWYLPIKGKRELVIREGKFCNSNYVSSLVDTRSALKPFVVEAPPPRCNRIARVY